MVGILEGFMGGVVDGQRSKPTVTKQREQTAGELCLGDPGSMGEGQWARARAMEALCRRGNVKRSCEGWVEGSGWRIKGEDVPARQDITQEGTGGPSRTHTMGHFISAQMMEVFES